MENPRAAKWRMLACSVVVVGLVWASRIIRHNGPEALLDQTRLLGYVYRVRTTSVVVYHDVVNLSQTEALTALGGALHLGFDESG